MKASSLLIALFLACFCGFAQDDYTFVLGGGSWTGEISMEILDADDNVIETLTATSGTVITLEAGCYTLVMYDSYGDGWNGSTYTVYDSAGGLVQTGDLDDASSGDGESLGYDELCVTGEPPECDGTVISIYSGGGYYDNEINWFLQDENGDTVLSDSNGGTVNACIPEGCYTIVMEDDWGDGWNGAVYMITDGDGEVLAMGGLEDGDYDSDQVEIGQGNCPELEAANYTPQDCMGAIVICSDETFGGNADAYGATQDLNTFNRGCLTLEHQSGWYVFSPITTGTISFTLTPSNGIDYDFAIWGPYENVDCPPLEDPLRCSYSALYEPTGLEVGTDEGDTSEDPDGDAWVEAITVTNEDLDKYYMMLIDNYTADATAFDFEWELDGVILNCAISLPVELVNFRGTEGQHAHQLEWETQTELNNAYFEVERSPNGILWQTVARIAGHGNSNVPHQYAFDDTERPFGTAYYRLRQVDFNGQFEYSETVALRHLAPFTLDKVYPNPSRDAARLLVSSDREREVAIELYDAGGRQVTSTTGRCMEGATALTLPTENLLPGYYQVVVLDQNGLRLGSLAMQRF